MRRIVTVAWVLLASGCGRTALLESEGQDELAPLDLQASVDSASSDSSVSNPACPGTAAETDAELLRRWNAAVDALPPQRLDFHWRDVNDFPHATFRGGTPEAYADLADVLVRFWAEPSNVSFVECHQLFDRAYNSGPPSETQVTVRLRPLTAWLSTYVSMVDAARGAALLAVCVDISC